MDIDEERRRFGIGTGVTEDLNDLLFERHLEKQLKLTADHDQISKAPTSKRRAKVRRNIQAIMDAREDLAIEVDHL